jgi:hypothetical protein
MKNDLRSVSLPSCLCEAAEQRFGSRFGGLEPFLAFVLEQLLRDDATRMDQADRQMVEERLRELGYV